MISAQSQTSFQHLHIERFLYRQSSAIFTPDQEFNMQLHGTLSIQELFKNKFISRAAYTICVREKLPDLAAIAEYQSQFKNFLRIRSCGDTTNEVLVSLCQQWARLPNKQKDLTAEEANPRPLTPADRWEAQTGEQRQDAENRFEALRNQLSRRAANKLLTLCEGNPTAETLARVLSNRLRAAQQSLLSPNNASGKALLSLVADFTHFLEKPSPPRDAPAGRLTLLRSRMSQLVPSHSASPMGRFLKEEWNTLATGQFPLLRFAHLFFQAYRLHPAGLTDAFLQWRPWYAENQTEPAEVVAARFGYTVQSLRETLYREKPERKLLRGLEEAVALLKTFGLVLPAAYRIAPVAYQRFGGADEDSPFSERFVVLLITRLNPAFVAVKLQGKEGTGQAFLRKEIAEQWDAAGFSASVRTLLLKKTPTGRMVTVEELAAPFCKQTVTDDENRELLSAAALLLQDFYQIYPDEKGCLYLPPTRAKFFSEHVYDILTEQNRACHIRDIARLLRERGIDTTAKGIQPRLQMSNQLMMMGGSTYGLREWEQRGLVGGTIKQLVKKYLTEAEEPKHVHEIVNYVLMHRDTNPKSIRSNIQNDIKGWFRFFGNGFFGLADRRYKNTLYKSIPNNWMYHTRKLFADAGTDRLARTSLADFLVNRYGIMPVQVERLLYKHILKGTFGVHGNELILLPAPVA